MLVIFRNFFIFNLNFGSIGKQDWSEFKIKDPALIAYFPLYGFTEEYTVIPSIGRQGTTLGQTKHTTTAFFENIPKTLLLHPKFPGWETSTLDFSEDLPFMCLLVVLGFEAICSAKEGPNLQEFTLMQFKSLNLTNNISLKLKAELDLTSSGDSQYFGTLTFWLLMNQVESFRISVKVKTINDVLNPEDLTNFSGVKSAHLSNRFESRGFYQVLSSQTLFIRVRI